MRYLVTLLIGFLLGVAVVATTGVGLSPVVARAQEAPTAWEYKYLAESEVSAFMYRLNDAKGWQVQDLWPPSHTGTNFWSAIIKRPAQ